MDWMKMSRAQAERARSADGDRASLARARASAFLRRAMGMRAGLVVIEGNVDGAKNGVAAPDPSPGPSRMTTFCKRPLTGTAAPEAAGDATRNYAEAGGAAPAQARPALGEPGGEE